MKTRKVDRVDSKTVKQVACPPSFFICRRRRSRKRKKQNTNIIIVAMDRRCDGMQRSQATNDAVT